MNTTASNSYTKHMEWLRLFLEKIRKEGIEAHVAHAEGYKFRSVNHFQTVFDLNAVDLAGNLDEALYPSNLVAGAMYFPKKMLLIYAERYPEETRKILQNLFDESIAVEDRIDETQAAFEELENRRAQADGHKPYNTYIGLRFISLLLGFMHPNTHNALKPTEWKLFARFMDSEFKMPQKTSAGQQYLIYQKFIEPLREFLMEREEVRQIRDALTNGLEFKDDGWRWITQDVIFVTARAYADKKSIEALGEERESISAHVIESDSEPSSNQADLEDTGFMALESHLEEYVVRNWPNIDFGEDLTMYVEDDGTTGQQYTTDVGILDILALDADNNFVVIELKRADSNYKVVGQVLNYIGWVQENLATNGQKVRGLIIVGKADKTLISSLKPVADIVSLKEYRVTLQMTDPQA